MRYFLTVSLLVLLSSPIFATSEQARSASDFVDSIGINTHYINSIFTGQNAYSFPAIDQKLADLGIKHIRDNTDGAAPSAFARLDNLYANYGIRSILVPNTTTNPAAIDNLLANHPVYEAVEGLNEPDFASNSYAGFADNPASHDFSATRAYQNDLYTAVKSNPLTAGITVLSPAMGNNSNAQYLAGTSFDVESMHSYPDAHSPTFNLDTNISRTNAMSSPPKPIYATETGYYTEPADGGEVSETAMGKYTPRLFAENFNRGIARTYAYELVDENPTSDKESNFGLLHWDLTPKPAYTTLQNLISELQPASNAPSSLGSLNYSLSTIPSTINHTLLERSDGVFCLLLWNEVASWSLTNQKDIINAPISATLTLGSAYHSVAVYEPNLSASPVSTYTNPTSISLSIPDQIMVIEFTAIPEPSSALLVTACLIFLGLLRTRFVKENAVGIKK